MTGVPRVRTSSLMAALVAASLSGSLLLAGCGSDTDAPDASAPRPASSTTATPSPEPTASTQPTTQPTAQPTASTRPPRKRSGGHKAGALRPRLRLTTAEHLLGADRLPTVGDRAWAVEATGPEDPERDAAVGACQKTLLGTIGAVETVRRTFSAPDRVTATQVVARFADARSAWRAHGVLVAWREDCAERVGRADVGPLEPVTVHTGTGEAYRTAARKRAAGLGILRTGSYLTLVEVTAGAERYPASWDPARVALRRVARTF